MRVHYPFAAVLTVALEGDMTVRADAPISIATNVGVWLPAPTTPPPEHVNQFSQETHSLARRMAILENGMRNDPPYFTEADFAAIELLSSRLDRVMDGFVDGLRQIHTTIPVYSGKAIRSFHETVILMGRRRREWLFGFLTPADLKAAKDHQGYDRLKGLGKAARKRFFRFPKPWPFDTEEFESLLAGIEFEADKLSKLQNGKLPENKSAQLITGDSTAPPHQTTAEDDNYTHVATTTEEFSKYRSPADWRAMLKDHRMGHSSSAWGEFRKAWKGDQHPSSKHRLIRFPLAELKRAGVTVPEAIKSS